MSNTKNIFLLQSLKAQNPTLEQLSKREEAFEQLRAIGAEISMPTHDIIELKIPEGKAQEAADILLNMQARTELPRVPTQDGAPALTVHVVTWAIEQDGSESHGQYGVYTTKELALQHALECINEQWVQGAWDQYPTARIDQLRLAVASRDYEKALSIWADMPTSFVVHVSEMEVEGAPKEITLEDLDLSDEAEEDSQ